MDFQAADLSSGRTDVAWMAQDLTWDTGLIEVNYGPFFTGNVEAVKMNLIANTQASSHKLDFYADQECTLFMQGTQFDIRSGGTINTSFPALGAWMLWRATPRVGPATATVRLSSGVRSMKPFSSPGQNVLFSRTITPLAAGVTDTMTVFPTSPGLAFWSIGYVANDAGAWEAFLESESAAGAVQLLDYGCSKDGRIARHVYLPNRPTRIRITNLDAAAHSYNATLLGDPGLF